MVKFTYAIFPRGKNNSITINYENDDETEITINIADVLDWSDIGVRVGDTLAESFCSSLQTYLLVFLSEWASEESILTPERYNKSWWFLHQLIPMPFQKINAILFAEEFEKSIASRGNVVRRYVGYPLDAVLGLVDC